MSFEVFRHPSSTKSCPKISNQTVPKLLATTLCRESTPNVIDVHAATLYKVDDGNYVFKNTYPDEPEIKIPITRQIWPPRDGLLMLLV